MARIRKGTEVEKNGRWYGRVRWKDEQGKRRDLWLPAKNKTHAAELVEEKLQELKHHGEKIIDAARMTFEDLALHNHWC